MKIKTDISPREFYLRSFTLGILPNMGGAVRALGMLAAGHRPKRYGNCIHFEAGKGWGGRSAGIFLFTEEGAPQSLLDHEHGHSLQNCFYGPLMPLAVNLPSTARYYGRKLLAHYAPHKLKGDYYDAWFEAEASRLGTEFMNRQRSAAQEEMP